jgi:prepilin signal peptidase PulO-like enzyme (type II secretory pathway)
MPIVIYIILAGVLGILTGSIVNATVLRTKAGLPLMSRARCLSCVEPLHWFDLIPVVSYFVLKGRCRRCSAAIEWQYPAVELAVGLLFALFAGRILFGLGIPSFITGTEQIILFIRDAVVSVFLVIIFLYDFRFSVIPDKFSVPAIILVILFNLVLGASAFSMLIGGLAIGGFFSVQFLVSQGKWVGGGDIRMGLLMGFLLGLPLGMVALFLSYILGAFGGVVLLLGGHRSTSSHVPFGTFMAGATVVTMIFGSTLLSSYLSLLQ